MHLQRRVQSLLFIAISVVFLVPFHEAKADGGTTMAGILSDKGYDEFSFMGSGDEILFVELKAAVYQTKGRMGGTHEEAAAVADPILAAEEEGGGCSGEDGGPGGFCLQVLESADAKEPICWADRPMQPGWMRDPSLACPLSREGSNNYILRIFPRREGEGVCKSTTGFLAFSAEDSMAKRLYTIDITKITISNEGPLYFGGGKP